MRAAIWIFAGLAAYLGLRTVTRPTLRHFKPTEFGIWWPMMSGKQLLLLDEFRHRWGSPVDISAAVGSVGRENDSGSQHNFLRWGEIRATDVMPRDMDTPGDRERAVEIAREVGFTGIGVYPDWKPRGGLHLDVRADREAGDPALWSGLKIDGRQALLPIERGFA